MRLSRICFLIFAAMSMLAVSGAASKGEEIKLEAQLVWGTDNASSPDSNHKPAEEEVAKRLKAMGLKWKHYFENPKDRQSIKLKEGESQKIKMSPDASLIIKYLGEDNFEIGLLNKDNKYTKYRGTIPKGHYWNTGGPIGGDSSAWFIILKR